MGNNGRGPAAAANNSRLVRGPAQNASKKPAANRPGMGGMMNKNFDAARANVNEEVKSYADL